MIGDKYYELITNIYAPFWCVLVVMNLMMPQIEMDVDNKSTADRKYIEKHKNCVEFISQL